jgi:hypothetical protein
MLNIKLLTATTFIACLMITGCASPLPEDPDDYTFEQSKKEYERVRATIGEKEAEAIFGACSKTVANEMSGVFSLNEAMQPIYICFIKAAK